MKNKFFLKITLLLVFLINYFNVFALYFPDVSNNHWSVSYIKEAVEKWIIKGFSDWTFKPNNSISFAEAISITFKTFWKVKQDTTNLTDWKVPYINYFNQNGYISGTYKPENYINRYNNPITRELAIYVLLKTKWVDFGSENEKNFSYNNIDTGFSDVKKDSNYALYIKYAKDNKISKWYENWDFWFWKNITRAEFLSMLLLLNKRDDLSSVNDYIKNLNLLKIDISSFTYSNNPKIKWQSFIDSTKIASTDKIIYNNRWYIIQSEDYYKSMNENQTPIKVAWSFWDTKTIYHNEVDWWKFVWKDWFNSKDSWEIQRIIDTVRYNDNFYFKDLYFSTAFWIPDFIDTIWWISSYKELKLVWDTILKNNGNYKEIQNILSYLKYIFAADTTFSAIDIISIMHITTR